MIVEQVKFYLYANSQESARLLEKDLQSFVMDYRNDGIPITAEKLSMALRQFGNNAIVKAFMKDGNKSIKLYEFGNNRRKSNPEDEKV